jgi:exonuclease III
MSKLTLLTWNVAGRIGKLQNQLECIASCKADVVALQEVTGNTMPKLRDGLGSQGFNLIFDSRDGSPLLREPSGPRKYDLLLASKLSASRLKLDNSDLPWEERVLGVTLKPAEGGEIDLYTTHVPPGSSNGWAKIETFEAIHKLLGNCSDRRQILCGDLNSPKEEMDGRVIPWGARWVGGEVKHEHSRNVPPPHPPDRWARGELSVLEGLKAFNMNDVFRHLHPDEKEEAYSWVLRRKAGNTRRRYDHVFASESLEPRSAEYLHDPLNDGFSDHAPLLVVVGVC